jgi:hypothetical protein
LADPEARLLIEWLVDQIERSALVHDSDESIREEAEWLCRRARAISRFVVLWCHRGERGAALQLAAAERLSGTFPHQSADPFDLMQEILATEIAEFAA